GGGGPPFRYGAGPSPAFVTAVCTRSPASDSVYSSRQSRVCGYPGCGGSTYRHGGDAPARSTTVQLSHRVRPWIALPALGSVSGSCSATPSNSYAPPAIRFGHGISFWPRP